MQNHAFIEKNAQQQACGAVFAHSGAQKGALRFAVLFVLALALFSCVSAIAPQQALAKSYDMPKTTIDATIQPNGDLHVVEQREFDFSGSYTAVWWEFDSLPSGSSIEINSVSMADADSAGNATAALSSLSSTPFQVKWRESGGPGNTSYSFDEPKNTVYVFFNKDDQNAIIQLDYTVKLAAQSYSDVGELYWQFVGSGWAEASDNVTMTLHLPVASGQTVTAGDNVRAWGHGPLNGTVAINEEQGTVTYTAPHVSSGNYAEARVVFPTAWLSSVDSKAKNSHESTSRLSTVLSEEQTWADTANAQRGMQMGSLVFAIVLCVALLAWGIRSFIRYGKELKPNFTDEYWRDVPVEGEHPAVVARIWRFGKEDPSDLSATIMHLANAGALLINKGAYEKKKMFRTKQVEAYYLTRVPEAELKLNSEIDRKAMSFLFDTVGKGEPSLWLDSIKEYAEANPESFNNEMMAWQGMVTSHANAGEYIEGYSNSKTVRMAVVAVLLIVFSFALGIVMDNLLVIVPCAITGIALLVVSRFMSRRTQKGADAYARCQALKKWLTEFSALNERPTTDVKVWGEFMVYAYIFGVAKEAIAELRKAVPEMFNVDDSLAANTAYVPWWVWYSSYGYGPAAGLPDFGSMLESSLTESVQAVESVLSGDSSSGGGFGGGFSMGGGGGFGGGGGAR